VSLDDFMRDFAPEVRTIIAARTAEPIEEELAVRDPVLTLHLSHLW
jgi:hypothetical protein